MASFGHDKDQKGAGIQRMLALSRYLNQHKDKELPLRSHVREVVVATRYIPAGVTITSDMVELRPAPADNVPPDVFTDVALVVGLRARASIGEGEAVRISAAVADAPPSRAPTDPPPLAAPAAATNPGSPVPPGKRAMTVPVDRVLAVGGLLAPGSFVDVVGVFAVGRAPSGGKRPPRYVAATVLQNVEVLAVASGEDRPPRQAAAVALAVSPEQAQLLAVAAENGTLRLAVRSPGDDQDVTLWPVSDAELWRRTRPGLPEEE